MNASAPIDVDPSFDAERALLGALLVNADAYHRIADLIEPSHFAIPEHGAILEAMATIIGEGGRADAITIRPLLPTHFAGNIPTMAYLAGLISDAGAPVAARDYASAVFDYHRRRSLRTIAEDIANCSDDLPEGMTVDALIADSIDRFRYFEQGPAARGAMSISGALEDLMKAEASRGTTTGLADLDRLLCGGLHRGDLVIVGARPSMGKSSLIVKLCQATAMAGLGAHLVSMEMPARQIGARAVTDLLYDRYASVPYAEILAGSRRYDDRIASLYDTFARLPFSIDDRAALSPAQIEASARRAKAGLERKGIPLGVIGVDYLQLMRAGDRYKGQRTQEVGEFSAAMKALARTLDVPVVVLSQLSRNVEQRNDKRPMLSDLRDSGSLEQDADVVMFLYREAYYLAKGEEADPDKEIKRQEAMERHRHDLEIIVAKQRNGPTGTVHCHYDGPSSAIRNAARHYGAAA